ncbi:MAG TPA: hypothetical protein VLA43_18275, partial [Longimicrobiales bacterium]|nr:hypothetical protein [Longimicrobiales bacterium]
AGPAFATLGVDVLSVAHETADNDGPGRDPGVGGFAGLGYALTPGTSGPHLFLEGGVHALAVTGELTNGGGVYATLMLGVAF